MAQSLSDPICNSSGCTQYLHPEDKPSHPIDYPVADFGLDHDIVGTDKSLGWSQEDRVHKWHIDTGSKDFKWADLPHVDAEFKLV